MVLIRWRRRLLQPHGNHEHVDRRNFTIDNRCQDGERNAEWSRAGLM
jgi:hypothetical protein